MDKAFLFVIISLMWGLQPSQANDKDQNNTFFSYEPLKFKTRSEFSLDKDDRPQLTKTHIDKMMKKGPISVEESALIDIHGRKWGYEIRHFSQVMGNLLGGFIPSKPVRDSITGKITIGYTAPILGLLNSIRRSDLRESGIIDKGPDLILWRYVEKNNLN